MKRTASTTWRGGLQDGKGLLTTQSGVLSDTPYSFGTGVWGSMDTAGEFDFGAHPQKHQLGAVS